MTLPLPLSQNTVDRAQLAAAEAVFGRPALEIILYAPPEDLLRYRRALGVGPAWRSVADLISDAAAIYGVTADQIRGRRRSDRLTRARHWVMYHAAREGHSSLPLIGRLLGTSERPRDHSTVIHGARKHALRHRLPQVIGGTVPDRLLATAYDGSEPSLASPWEARP